MGEVVVDLRVGEMVVVEEVVMVRRRRR